MKNKKEILLVLKEMRDACAACFRVIGMDHKSVRLLNVALKEAKIKEGFGMRCQELIKKLERK
jgi:hypothetical protein